MIKTLRRVLLGAGIALCGLGGAQAAPFIIFGDSLSDAGSAQASALAGGRPSPTPASLGYFEGRFSNGPVAADYVSQTLTGSSSLSFLFGGDNYAFGGAAIVTDINQGSPGLPTAIPDLTDQVGLFLTRGPISADTDIYVGFAGNDFLAALVGAVDPSVLPSLAIPVMEQQLTLLSNAGATNVAVSNVWAAGFSRPGDNSVAAAASIYNQQLTELLVRLSMETGTRFSLVDRNSLFNDLVGNPAAFGFDPSKLGTPCITVVGAAPTCEGFLLFDPVHTTTAAQALTAMEIEAALNAEVPLPAAAWLFLAGLGGLVVRRRKAA